MNGLMEPNELLKFVSERIEPFVACLEDTRKESGKDRNKKLKDCLLRQQRRLLTSLVQDGSRAERQSPFIWVNAYIECDWGDSRETHDTEKWLDKIFFSPAAIDPEKQATVDAIHERILTYVSGDGGESHSLTQLLNSPELPLITAFRQKDDRITSAEELPSDPGFPEEAWQKYSKMLLMNDNPQWHYVHIASRGHSSELVRRSGVYLMAENAQAWRTHGIWVAMAFRLFLSELTSAYLLEQTQQLLSEQRRLLHDADAQRRIFNYIRTPARDLAAQVRSLEVQAGKIQRVLAPLRQNLFRDLQRGSDFFNTPPGGTVVIDGKLGIKKAHRWDDAEEPRERFVLAVLARVLDLDQKGYITEWKDLEALAKRVLKYDFRPDFKKTSEALRTILDISDPEKIPDEKWKTYFSILKDVCHSPFKASGYSFDANLCYALFDATRRKGEELKACSMAPPSPPELFLEGCRAFVAPVRSDGTSLTPQISFTSGSDGNTLLISCSDKEPVFEKIKEPDVLAGFVKGSLCDRHGTRASSDEDGGDEDGKKVKKAKQGKKVKKVKTLLWEWATTPLVDDRPLSDIHGDTVGALVLIFGYLAEHIAGKRKHDGTAVISASSNDKRLTITLNASDRMRSVRIRCKSRS